LCEKKILILIEDTSHKAKNFTALGRYCTDIKNGIKKTEKEGHLSRTECLGSCYFSGRTAVFL